jgi:hypothetical protein
VNALTSPEVAALHAIAKRDRRLAKPDRVILAEIARTGHVGRPEHLARSAGLKSPADAVNRVAKLRELRYLPAATS